MTVNRLGVRTKIGFMHHRVFPVSSKVHWFEYNSNSYNNSKIIVETILNKLCFVRTGKLL